MENTSPLMTPTLPVVTRRLRTWPPALVLLFLSPIVGEMISGSTPPLLFIQPFALIFLPTLYGISALIIHEIIVRRRLGWGNALVLGAAFGIFQEALVVQTWFNFMSPRSPTHSLGMYGVLWSTNWDWALNLTIYHAVVSITVPLILIGLFYPERAQLPWLGKKSIIALVIWMFLLCGLLAYGIGFRTYAADGYVNPPLYPYLTSVALNVCWVCLVVFVRIPASRLVSSKPAPGLWRVRFTYFGLMTLFFMMVIVILPATHMPVLLAMLLGTAVLVYALWLVRSWSVRTGWNIRHQLAIATGILMYFCFVFAPIVEFAMHLPLRTGLTVTDILIFIGLLFFDQRLKRRLLQQQRV